MVYFIFEEEAPASHLSDFVLAGHGSFSFIVEMDVEDVG
jgi:hypothetical protein